MKKRSFNSACLLLSVFLLTSCDASRRVTAAHTRQPKFISGIYLHGHSKTGAADDAIDDRKGDSEAPLVLTHSGEKPVHKNVADKEDPRMAASTLPVIRRKKQQSEILSADNNEETDIATTNDIEPMGLRYADMVGISGKAAQNSSIYRFIQKWYGTHYRLGGDNETGIDCSGFSRKLYGDVYGIDLTRTAQDQFKHCKRKKKTDEPEEGDLVFFRQRGKRITHVGVYLANNYFVHSSTSQGVVISSLKEDYWRRHFAGVGKVLTDNSLSGL
jgi:lipoprotein Spr